MDKPRYETGDLGARRKEALDNCEARIKWYERNSRRSRILSRTSQSAVVVLGALSPVLILLPGVPASVQALPAALAAIAAGVGGFWRWQENWVRFAYTAEALKGERIKFRTRTGEAYRAPLGDEQALDNFVGRVEDLVLNETAEWRTLLRNHAEAREPE